MPRSSSFLPISLRAIPTCTLQKILLLLLLQLVSTPASSIAATLHVSPSGSDQNPGTARAPLASPQGARDRIRSLGIAGKERVTVEFAPGTYRLDAPLVLKSGDSGTAKNPILYRAARGASVEWSGGRLIKANWKPAARGILQTSVQPGTSADQLFINGKRQILARHPNFDPNQRILGGFSKDAVSPARAARWKNPTGGFLHTMHRHEWGDLHYRITRKNPDGTVTLEGGWQNNRAEEGNHPTQRYVENIFEELDAPGEWFLDSEAGILHFQPPSGLQLDNALVEMPVLKHLVEFRGNSSDPVRFVSLQGITFRHTLRTFMENREPLLRSDWTTYRGGAILFDGAEDCALRDSTLLQLGGNGVFVNGYNRRIQITGCEIREAGASSIAFVGSTNAVRSPLFNYHQTLPANRLDLTPGPKSPEYPADCLVEDCLLVANGRVEKQTAGVQIAMASRITVRHCSIYECPRAGINIGDGNWGGHIIEYCDIFDTVRETGDHGAFNSWGRDRFWVPNIKEVDRRVEANPALPLLDVIEPITLRNNRWRCDHGWDIDLDDGSSNYVLENNLCLNGGIKLREGYQRRVENNIMVNNSFHPHVWFARSGDLFRRNITMAGYYPIGMPRVWGSEINFNLLPNDAALGRARELGLDTNSVAGAPGFMDAARGDFRVRRGSPALALGFKNFPMDRFGVQKPSLRAIAKTAPIPQVLNPALSGTSSESAPSFWMGATVKRISSLGERSAAGLPSETGVALLEVPPSSPAAQLGLQTRDVLLRIGREDISSVGSLRAAVAKIPVTTKAPVTLQRDQKQVKTNVTFPQSQILAADSAQIVGDFPLPNFDAAKNYIGGWTTLKSSLEWRIKSPGPGKYRVWMESAAPASNAGSVVEFAINPGSVRTTIPATGGWEDFKSLELGTIQLDGKAGDDLHATLKPVSKPGQAVMNFRAIHLIRDEPSR